MKNVLRSWRKLCIVGKSELLISIFTQVIILICSIVEPIALSSFIESASIRSSALAIIWVFINLGLIIIEHISWHINYANYTRLITPTYLNLQKRVTKAVLNAGILSVDKTKLDYCINSDIFGIATFLDSLILRLASFFKFLIMLIIIFVYSYTIGAMLVVMSAVGFSLLLMYNKLKKTNGVILRKNEINADKKTQEILNLGEVIKKYNLENPVLFEQERRLLGYCNSYNTLYTKKSIKDNFIQIYWYTMLSVIFLVSYFEFNTLSMSLTVFLIIIDYSSSFVKLTESAFDFTIEISDLEEKLNRTQDILKLEETTPSANQDIKNEDKISANKNETEGKSKNINAGDLEASKKDDVLKQNNAPAKENYNNINRRISPTDNDCDSINEGNFGSVGTGDVMKDENFNPLKNSKKQKSENTPKEQNIGNVKGHKNSTECFVNNVKENKFPTKETKNLKGNSLIIKSPERFSFNGSSTKVLTLFPGNIYIFASTKAVKLFYSKNLNLVTFNDFQTTSVFNLPETLSVSDQNEMFADCILENLQIIQNDVEKIGKITDSLGIDELLTNLNLSEKENASLITDKKIIILLNIVRAILSDAKIIYLKFSEELFDFGKNILKTFKTFAKEKLVLIYDPASFLSGKTGIFVE